MKHLLLFLAVFLISCSLFGQYEASFFGMDTAQSRKHCVLPILYFQPGQTQLNPNYEEELRYIAFMLHLNPQMSIRLTTESVNPRFKNKQRKLSKQRVNLVAKKLKKDFGIPKRRIVKIPYRPWVFRGANVPEPHPLIQRRVICEAIWD